MKLYLKLIDRYGFEKQDRGARFGIDDNDVLPLRIKVPYFRPIDPSGYCDPSVPCVCTGLFELYGRELINNQTAVLATYVEKIE